MYCNQSGSPTPTLSDTYLSIYLFIYLSIHPYNYKYIYIFYIVHWNHSGKRAQISFWSGKAWKSLVTSGSVWKENSSKPYCYWLVVYLPLWKIWMSVGMMTFPIYGKIKFMFQTTNQHSMCDMWCGHPEGISIWIDWRLMIFIHYIYCSLPSSKLTVRPW